MAARAVDRLIGLLSVAILARLLVPADFGVVAVAGTVVAAIELLSAFGFDWALVRHRDPSSAYLNTAWTLRFSLGVFTLVALTLIGPSAAAFYHLPALRGVLPAMGIASFATSLENIGTVYFRRDFAFHKEFLLRSLSKISGFLVTILVALNYRSFWALVAGIIAGRCAATVASYFAHPYRPRPSLREVRALFGFSVWLLLGNVIDYFQNQFATLYLGRVFGARVNGLFSLAGEMSQVPIAEVAAPINRVAYSKYAEDLRTNRPVQASYFGVAALIWAVALPMAAGTIAVADEAVRLLLGSKWHDAVPVVRLFALATVFTVLTANTHYVYWALGMSRIVAMLSAIGAAVIVPATIVFGHLWGYEGVACASVVTNAALVPINFLMLRRLGGIGFLGLWARTWRVTLAAVVMLLGLWLLFPVMEYASSAWALLLLAVKIVAGAILYATVVFVTWILSGKPEGPESTILRNVHGWMRRA
jgi:lipopolysaccharide exporter